MNCKKSFGVNVRAHRQARGYSQEGLAEVCGLHRTYIGSLERGERNVSLENICKIAKALGCNPSDLLKDVK